MSQPQKWIFEKYFTITFDNFALKIETGWAIRMVLKTRNVNDDAC